METNQARLKAILEGGIVLNSLQVNKTGYNHLIRQIQGQLSTMDSENNYHYLEELYDESFVYEKYGSGQPAQYFRQSYNSKSDGTVEFTGEPSMVTKKIEFINVNNSCGCSNLNSKEKTTMKMKKEQVDELINNERTNFVEADRDWLSELPEVYAEKLEPPMVVNKRKEVIEIEKEIDDTAVTSYLADKPLEDIVKMLPDSLQANVQSAMDLRKTFRENTVKGIMANSKDVWTEDELNAMSCSALTKIAKSLNVEETPASYAGQPAGKTEVIEVNSSLPAPMLPVVE